MGPDPVHLPLVASGLGDLNEMRENYKICGSTDADVDCIYGFTRINMQTGEDGDSKFVVVQQAAHVPNGDSTIKRGQLASRSGAMQKAILEIAHIDAVIEISNSEDLTLDFIKTSMQNSSLTAAARGRLNVIPVPQSTKVNHPLCNSMVCAGLPGQVGAFDFLANCLGKDCTRTIEASNRSIVPSDNKDCTQMMQDDCKSIVQSGSKDITRAARRVVPKYVKGQAVMVFCACRNLWFDDGVVVQVLEARDCWDGLELPRGSVKVLYTNNSKYTWLRPKNLKEYLKSSARPLPPAGGAGELYKQTHGWITGVHDRFLGLDEGYLQWWRSIDDWKKGLKSKGGIFLEGLEIEVSGVEFSIQTKKTMGVVYTFSAKDVAGSKSWSDAIQRHGKWCDALLEYKKKTRGPTPPVPPRLKPTQPIIHS